MTMVLITLVADQFPIDLMTIAQWCIPNILCNVYYRFNTAYILDSKPKRDGKQISFCMLKCNAAK